MNIEKELIKALESMDESDFDALLGDIELSDSDPRGRVTAPASRAEARRVIGKENNGVKNKTGKRSAAMALILAAAVALAAAAGAVGIGYLASHKDAIDGYFGAGAGDRMERQGLYDSEEIAVGDHLKVTRETTLSAGCISAVIVTVEAVDEMGRDYIAGAYGGDPSVVLGQTQPDGTREDAGNVPDGGSGNPGIAFVESKVTGAFGRNLEGWAVRPRYGDGYMTFMFIFEYSRPETDITVPLELYMTAPDASGDGIFDGTDLESGYYLCTVEFSTEPNVRPKAFVGEDSGRVIRLYDYMLLSDRYVPVIDETSDMSDRSGPEFDVEFIYADGGTYRLGEDDVELMHHFETGAEGADAADTRLVFGCFIDPGNVETVVICGERYTAQ